MDFNIPNFENVFSIFDDMAQQLFGVGRFIQGVFYDMPPIFTTAIILSIVVGCVCVIIRALTF